MKNSISKSGWSRVGCRSLVILFSAACFAAVSPTWAGSEQVDALAQIYAGTDWYRARPEPEEQKRGILRERDAPIGPAARVALRYVLITDKDVIPVYAPEPSQRLAMFVGQAVVAYGKLVDLSKEGFGKEFWIGSIQRSSN
jgi:hypothetical protein